MGEAYIPGKYHLILVCAGPLLILAGLAFPQVPHDGLSSSHPMIDLSNTALEANVVGDTLPFPANSESRPKENIRSQADLEHDLPSAEPPMVPENIPLDGEGSSSPVGTGEDAGEGASPHLGFGSGYTNNGAPVATQGVAVNERNPLSSVSTRDNSSEAAPSRVGSDSPIVAGEVPAETQHSPSTEPVPVAHASENSTLSLSNFDFHHDRCTAVRIGVTTRTGSAVYMSVWRRGKGLFSHFYDHNLQQKPGSSLKIVWDKAFDLENIEGGDHIAKEKRRRELVHRLMNANSKLAERSIQATDGSIGAAALVQEHHAEMKGASTSPEHSGLSPYTNASRDSSPLSSARSVTPWNAKTNSDSNCLTSPGSISPSLALDGSPEDGIESVESESPSSARALSMSCKSGSPSLEATSYPVRRQKGWYYYVEDDEDKGDKETLDENRDDIAPALSTRLAVKRRAETLASPDTSSSRRGPATKRPRLALNQHCGDETPPFAAEEGADQDMRDSSSTTDPSLGFADEQPMSDDDTSKHSNSEADKNASSDIDCASNAGEDDASVLDVDFLSHTSSVCHAISDSSSASIGQVPSYDDKRWTNDCAQLDRQATGTSSGRPQRQRNGTMLHISSDNAPDRAPLWFPFSKIDGVHSLFDEATQACKIHHAQEISVTFGWSGKRLLLPDGDTEAYRYFCAEIDRAWKQQEQLFLEEGCEVKLLVHTGWVEKIGWRCDWNQDI